MPSRIIKQSICTSESMASLSWFEQIVFIRLIVSVDDYGRYDGRPAIIKGSLFPLEDVTEKAIRAALQTLSTSGMVKLYTVGGRSTLELVNWRKYNVPRAKESKYPAPTDGFEHLQADANKCNQANADATVIRNSNPNFEIRNSDANAPAPARGSSFTSFWDAYPNKINRDDAWNAWKSLNPGADTVSEIMNGMEAWKKSERWSDDGGRYIPSAAKWLRDRRWEISPPAGKQRVPMGASGQLGEAELEAIQRVLREVDDHAVGTPGNRLD